MYLHNENILKEELFLNLSKHVNVFATNNNKTKAGFDEVRLQWFFCYRIPSFVEAIALMSVLRNIFHNCQWTIISGLQLRKSEQNGFHDNFLISQPNPMM